MNVITSQHADAALYNGLSFFCNPESQVVETQSRNGRVLRAADPVTSVYEAPTFRTLFNPIRDANPAFGLFESLWMLAGRNDVGFVAAFVKQMAAYSDDGQTLNGAYGHRWRQHFGIDQLTFAIEELRRDPTSRRVNIQMWDAHRDPQLLMNGGSKDVPCNTNMYVEVQDGQLNLTVCNRSNDMIWGAYGANYVHFGFVQEYLACALGLEVGTYTQVSRNAHIYLDNPVTQRLIQKRGDQYILAPEYVAAHANVDEAVTLASFKLFDSPDQLEDFEQDLNTLFSAWDRQGKYTCLNYRTRFMQEVVEPVGFAHMMHKTGETQEAIAFLEREMIKQDRIDPWLLNMKQWLVRRA